MAPKRRRNSTAKRDESPKPASSEAKLSNTRKNGNGPARRGRPAKAAPINPNLPSRYLVRSVYIGVGNARRWSEVKRKLGYAGDVDFVAFLLAMAEDHARGQIPNLELSGKLAIEKPVEHSLADEDEDDDADSPFLDEQDFPELSPQVRSKSVGKKRDGTSNGDSCGDQYKTHTSKLSVTVASRKDYSGAIEVSNGLGSESVYDFAGEGREGSSKSRADRLNTSLRRDNGPEDDEDEEGDGNDENGDATEDGIKKEGSPLTGSLFGSVDDDIGTPCYLMPSCLLLEERDSTWGLTVVSAEFICKFFELGYLMGEAIQVADIEESFPMRHLWESTEEGSPVYFSTINPQKSNWWRHLRPASQPSEANVTFMRKNEKVQLYSTTDIEKGHELQYWVEDEEFVDKTKSETTKCIPCDLDLENVQFYRQHCALFHDPARSLSLKKYSCKVCGEELVGKEALVQHAAQFHEGKGAYQCNFCHKFFLRVNYLDMHRTYGCSANPQRCRPKCDICGRNFCQPQKLKTHIQRVHGEPSEEPNKQTSCKLCDKSFDTRPALQRHLKEVHKKDMTGNCACDQCGKLFQNKSNLKIHMLTHSGVKPFKCPEEDCGLGFSTKQCLQVHLKKGHGFSEGNMPKVERSVPYTFDAYSGGAVRDPGRGKTPLFVSGQQPRRKNSSNNSGDSPANPIPSEPKKGAKRRGRQPGWRKSVLVAEDFVGKETENSTDKDLPVSDISGRNLSDDSSSVSSPTTTCQSSPATTGYSNDLVPPPQQSYEVEAEVDLATKAENTQREVAQHALDYSSRLWSTNSNELNLEHNQVHPSTLEDLNENNTSWRNLTLSPPPSSDDQGLDMSLTSNQSTNRQQPATPIAMHEDLRSPPLAYPERPASCYANDIITSFSRPLSRPIPSRPLSRTAYGVPEPIYPPSNFAGEPAHEFDERDLQLPSASPSYTRQPDTSRSSPFQSYPQPAYTFSQPQTSHPSPSPSPGLQNAFHGTVNSKPFPNYPPRLKPTTMMPPNAAYGTEIPRSMTPMPDYSRFTNSQQVHRGLPSPGASSNNNPYPSPAASPGFHPPPSPRVLPSGYQNFQNLGYQNYPLAPPPYNRPAGQVYNPYGNYY